MGCRIQCRNAPTSRPTERSAGRPPSPGTELCYHHAKVKSALGKWTPADQAGYGEFTPIPFIFPEDRASLQIDYFLLFQAMNEQRVERRAAEVMFRMLKAMAANLGKSGSLVEASDPRSGEPTSQKRDVGHPQVAAASEKTISVQASASAEVSAGPIAPESCFSTKPPTRSLTDLRKEVFRTSTLHPAGQRVLNLYFKPVEREEWRTDRQKFHGF